mmetsp:Transcript_3995/g.10793  ORF Transcript_3995/g.10793 Transcript_3995/m.10793 type:complete len:92 (+) Transcript_3995:155-430(+)
MFGGEDGLEQLRNGFLTHFGPIGEGNREALTRTSGAYHEAAWLSNSSCSSSSSKQVLNNRSSQAQEHRSRRLRGKGSLHRQKILSHGSMPA